jgi:hypothetical protein
MTNVLDERAAELDRARTAVSVIGAKPHDVRGQTPRCCGVRPHGADGANNSGSDPADQ